MSKRGNQVVLLGDGTAVIYLTKGRTCSVDQNDLKELLRYTWFASCKKEKFWYATTKLLGFNVHMHQILLRRPFATDGLVSDHKNGDTLDNRRSNLREVTYSENNKNRRNSN